MAKKKCKYCGGIVDENAVICTSCGTNQKTGKSFKAYNEKKRKTFTQKLLILVILAALLLGCYYFFKRYRSQISELKSGLVTKITRITKTQEEKQEETQEEKQEETQEEKNKVPHEIVNFPLDIADAKNAGQYRIAVGRRLSVSKKTNSSKETGWMITADLNVRVLPAERKKESFRLKIYQGDSPNGKYELVYDQKAETKLQKQNSSPSLKDRFLTLPDRYKNAPAHIRKKILEQRKKAYERMGVPERSPLPASFCALFPFKSERYLLRPGQQDIYFRILLYDADGRIIKQHMPYRVEVPRQLLSGSSGNLNYRQNYFVKYGMDEDAIYPCFYPSGLSLYFDFRQPKAFRIVRMEIDGVEYTPVLGLKDRLTNMTDRKTRKTYRRYRSVLKFDYPFGGNVTLELKIKQPSGMFEKVSYTFYLPSPPPALHRKFVKGKDKVSICWDGIEKYTSPKDYSRLPALILSRNDREIKELASLNAGEHEITEAFKGEPLSYKLTLRNGETNNKKWTSKGGIQNCNVAFLTLNSKMSDVTVVVPDLKKKQPVRLEIVKSSLVFENTGIPAVKLLNKIISRVKREKSIVVYDTDARDYVIDEKVFAMAGDIRQKFAMKESDFAFQIRDYSRADGNGLEIWLFKRTTKKMRGHTAVENGTDYWRLASFKLGTDESEFDKIAGLLINTIKDKFDFYICPDTREKKIVPRNIICTSFRPLNQQHVIWNYQALSETFSLKLGESSDKVKILSKEDWDLMINERLNANHKGYDIIDNNAREVLLTGRMWHDGGTRCFFVKACDAFSGEILGTKIFKGRISEIAKATSQWFETFRLADDIKVDFQCGTFIDTRHYRAPWRVKKDYLRRYGLVFTAPQKPRRSRVVGRNFSPLEFAQRQWKDGFRNKAVSVLEDAWKKKKDFAVAKTLLDYYETLKYKHKGLALSREVMGIDNCPEDILSYYRTFKRMKASAEAMSRYQANSSESRSSGSPIRFDELFFADRDIICPEWGADGKYRTILFGRKYKSAEIMKNVNSPDILKDGVCIQAETINMGGVVYMDMESYVAVSMAGWQSVTPYSQDLPEKLLFTRTANLFPREFAGGFPKELYVISPIRAILELKDHLKCQIPGYREFNNRADFKDGYTYLKSLVKWALWRRKNKSSFILPEYLAMSILAKLHDKEALDLYENALRVPIPENYQGIMKLPENYRNGDFIAFRAYEGDRKAQKYITENSVYLDGYGSGNEREGFDIIFPLLKKMKSDALVKAVLKNGGKRGLYALRWARKKTLENLLVKYADMLPDKAYLIMGTRNDEAAWRWLKGGTLMQYFGRPEDELCIEFRKRHLAKVEELNKRSGRK